VGGAPPTKSSRNLMRSTRSASSLPSETHGRVDVVINNAGLMPLSPLEALRVEDWERTIDVNLKGVLYGIAAALPHMKEQRGGHIINVSSVAGHETCKRVCEGDKVLTSAKGDRKVTVGTCSYCDRHEQASD
jgi:NADP-dependent 3-hydroxy acid dehydrogenase YdfG